MQTTPSKWTKRQHERAHNLRSHLETLGFDDSDFWALRRCEMTLSRWAERECGDGSNWAIERDETTDKPFNVYHGEGRPRRYAIADLEKGALRRVAAIVKAASEKSGKALVWFHQSDPRGCALYVGEQDQLAGGSLESCYSRLSPIYV